MAVALQSMNRRLTRRQQKSLTDREQELLRCIAWWKDEYSRDPSYTELCACMGYSPTRLKMLLRRLCSNDILIRQKDDQFHNVYTITIPPEEYNYTGPRPNAAMIEEEFLNVLECLEDGRVGSFILHRVLPFLRGERETMECEK